MRRIVQAVRLLTGGAPAPDRGPDPAPPAPAASAPAPVPAVDHNMLIHRARGARLRAMPPGARRLLSAGCAGTWYFDWVRQCYGRVPEHLGIEFYMPRPDDLPPEVTWISNTAADMHDVADASCDLVFSGQNIEHLWPEEVAGFLAESARVLRPGGHLVIDSPNRLVTAPLNYGHAEHTVELTPQEARELAELAGFEVTRLAGIWLCRDPRTGRLLPWDANAAEADWSVPERLVAAAEHPDHSFIWWLEARRTDAAPEAAALRLRAEAIFAAAWPERTQRLIAYPGRAVETRADGDWIRAAPGQAGFVMYGPYMPLRPGQWRATLRLEWEAGAGGAICDATIGEAAEVVARAEVPAGQAEVTLEFNLDALAFAGQFRVVSTGGAGFAVRRGVVLEHRPA